MNKAFETITNELETEKNRADNKLKEIVMKDGHTSEYEFYNGKSVAYNYAKNFVQKVAYDHQDTIQAQENYSKEYPNCLPCAEKKPQKPKHYDITIKNEAGIRSTTAIYSPFWKKWFWDAKETDEVACEILAWAEKRKPYQPEKK